MSRMKHVNRIWSKFILIYALILTAVFLLIHFALYPFYINQYRRSIESAYSYCEKVDFIGARHSEDIGINDEIIHRGLHYTLMDEDFNVLESDEYPSDKSVSEKYREEKSLFSKSAKAVHEQSDKGEEVILRGKLERGNTSYYIAIYHKTNLLRIFTRFCERISLVILLLTFIVAVILDRILLEQGFRFLRVIGKELVALHEGRYSERIVDTDSNRGLDDIAARVNDLAERLYRMQSELDNYRYLLKSKGRKDLDVEEMRRELIAQITHQLKTPLAIISSQVELEMQENDPEKKEYYYQSIMEEIEKLSLLISEILHNVKGEQEGFAFIPRLICVSDLLNDLAPKYENWLLSKKISFSYQIEHGVFVEADSVQMEQVVHNYMMNACAHTKPGKTICLIMKRTEEGCRISVRNDGDGIPKSQQDRIWTSYYQGFQDGGHSEVGLGLYIVRDIMRKHGGSYGLVNVEGGVEFYTIFPYKLTPEG